MIEGQYRQTYAQNKMLIDGQILTEGKGKRLYIEHVLSRTCFLNFYGIIRWSQQEMRFRPCIDLHNGIVKQVWLWKSVKRVFLFDTSFWTLASVGRLKTVTWISQIVGSSLVDGEQPKENFAAEKPSEHFAVSSDWLYKSNGIWP